jgi:adenylate cyclase
LIGDPRESRLETSFSRKAVSEEGTLSEGRVERRLAAILAADVVGYSRLMGLDETGTLQRLRQHRRELIDPKIAEHKGRIVKTTGDGLLIEFPSVVEAVACAVSVQRGMAERNAATPAQQQIVFRAGINLGDVIVEDGDIHGDGVNVAARLEGIAEPGGICVSATVRDHIGDRLDLAFDDLGDQALKNISRPLRVYRVRTGAVDEPPKDEALEASAPTTPRFARRPLAAVAAAGLLILAGGSWLLWPKAPSTTASAPHLSIVVLPFTNLSGDKEQQYFADGIAEDLTTDLSRIPDMFVISRNTAFAYRDKPIDTKQIGGELGVRYVLEGSVQRSAKEVRVNAQLIDAATDAHLWAERFDRDVTDLFAVEDDVTSRIANTLSLEIVGAEAARPTSDPDALDYILRGRAAMNKPGSPGTYAEAIKWLERALALDPHSIEAQSWLALALVSRILPFMSDTAAADRARAESLIAQVLAISPGNPIAHYAKGLLLSMAPQQWAGAVPEFEAAVASSRNWATAIVWLGQAKFWSGTVSAMAPAVERAIRLSPRDPRLWGWYFDMGQADLLQSRTDESIVWFEKSISANPAFALSHAWLASAYGLKGDSERAVAEMAEADRLLPADIRRATATIAGVRRLFVNDAPNIRALVEATHFVGLRKAGKPED